MARINQCHIPENLYYQIDRHIWARIESDGTVSVGVTDLAQHLAGRIFYAKVKPVGQKVGQFERVATIESGQFIGAVPAAVGGEVLEINDQLPVQPFLLNQDPYDKGWIARILPADLPKQLSGLLTGESAVRAYQEKMRREKIGCF